MTSLKTLDAYGPVFQQKLIGLLLTNKEFLIDISDALDVEYFEHPSRKWIVGKIVEYYDRWHHTPTMEYMQTCIKKEDENSVFQLSILEEVKKAYTFTDESDLEWVVDEFKKFCLNQKLKSAIIKSVDLLEQGDYDSIYNIVSNAVKTTESKNIGLDYNIDIESRYRDTRVVVPTPWSEINELTQGGFGKGDLIILFGGPGSGKSWALIRYLINAVANGYNVVLYTLELSENYVGKRIDSALSGIPSLELELYRDTIESLVKDLPGRLIIKEYPPKRASLKTIEKHLKQLKLQQNIDIDVVGIDYLDLLKNSKSRSEKKEDLDDIYTEAKGLAREYDVVLVSPSQVNRAGAKDAVIEGDKAAGSYDKIMIADIIISNSRLKEDKLAGTARWHIMKNRYGSDGITYNCLFDASTGKIEILGLYDEDETPAPKPSLDNFNKTDKQTLSTLFQKL